MNLKDDNNTDGKSLLTRSKGSMGTVTVGSRSLPLQPLVIVCLGLLNAILMLAAIVIGIYCGKISDDPAPHQITAQAIIMEVKQLQIMHTEAIKVQEEAQLALKKELRSHQQLKLQLEQNATLSDGFQRQLETLQVERAALRSNASDTLDSCGRCPPGWYLFNTTCYFHSKSESNSVKSWNDSRDDCISRGASLTVIDNWEEQLNLFEYLPKLDPGIRPWWSRPGGIWIGLSDTQTEGHWVWLNNMTLLEGGYWIKGEPNNYANIEDCAAIINMNNPRETWYDANCQGEKEWLCEMEPN